MLREVPNTHAEAATIGEATLHAKVEATQEIQRMKEAMAHQAEKKVTSLKKLEVAERKAKVAADDLQAVVEVKFSRSPKTDSMCPLGLFLMFRP
jgi:hypothetical protein